MRNNIKALAASIIMVPIMASFVSAQARVLKGAEEPFPPTHGTATFHLTLAPSAMPDSLEQLSDKSLLIVEGYVQSIYPPWINSKSLETDAVLLVTRVLKGALSTVQIVVSQHGGTLGDYREVPAQYSLIQAGEHYILFLINEGRLNVPEHSGIPRYWVIGGGFGGALRADGDKIHVHQGTPAAFRDKYEGMSLGQLVTAVQQHVQSGQH